MENAVDALKIAFAVMVFTIALSLTMATFSQARKTSEAVLYMNDKTNYYEYKEAVYNSTNNNYEVKNPDTNVVEMTFTSQRIVGIETIIPTLYRYYKENYTVIFEIKNGDKKLPIYYLDDKDKWNKNYSGSSEQKISYFDLNSEIKANCPWVGTVNDIKKNLDLFLEGTSGKPVTYISFGNINRKVKYDGFIEYVKTTSGKFLEQLGEYSTDRTYGMNEDGLLEVQDANGKIAKFEQSNSIWKCIEKNEDFNVGDSKKLEEIAKKVGSSSSTFLDPDSGEIIELAKPTIKRVIKYTLQ